MNKHKKGFTLIELLVVISIISLLSSIVLASLSSARGKARYASTLTTFKQFQNAAELYYNDNGAYPPDVSPGNNPGLTALSTWPKAECAGWSYDWENWSDGTVRVTLRKTSGAGVYFYCFSVPGSASCGADGSSILAAPSKTITCGE